jgi:hypothetical protein
MRLSSAIMILGAACAASLTAQAQIKAQGYDTPSYIEFSAPRFEVNGTETNAVITIVRTGDYRRIAAVDYATKDGTAEGNINFRPSGGTIVFDAGQSLKTINIPIIRDEPTPPASFQVELTAAAYLTLVTTPTAEVEIKSPPPPLAISATGQNISITWPDLGQTFVLQALINGAWASVLNSPSLENGDWKVQLSPASEAPIALFRLQLQE